jgi:hypothetical protein
MNFKEYYQCARPLLPDFVAVGIILISYVLTEVLVLGHIRDQLYRWLVFFLVTALFSNLLAKHLSEAAQRP